jgi:hypothetical protein
VQSGDRLKGGKYENELFEISLGAGSLPKSLVLSSVWAVI